MNTDFPKSVTVSGYSWDRPIHNKEKGRRITCPYLTVDRTDADNPPPE